jgi:SAM-dependent methyltransferase
MDIALMFDVIEHVPFNTESVVFKEVHRVLRKKGKFLLSTPHNNLFTNILDPAWYLGHRHYKKEQIKRLLEQSGFRVLDIEVRGGLWFSIYLIWLYFYKWILKNPYPRSQFLEKKDDLQFSREGIHTIFCVAEKL